MLGGDCGQCLVEVKSTTYLVDGVALFPDAKTERGRKHLHALGDALDHGFNALQFFVVARSDAGLFRPAEAIDLAYAQSLRLAQSRGVKILAYALRFNPIAGREPHEVDLEVVLDQEVPVDLS